MTLRRRRRCLNGHYHYTSRCWCNAEPALRVVYEPEKPPLVAVAAMLSLPLLLAAGAVAFVVGAPWYFHAGILCGLVVAGYLARGAL